MNEITEGYLAGSDGYCEDTRGTQPILNNLTVGRAYLIE